MWNEKGRAVTQIMMSLQRKWKTIPKRVIVAGMIFIACFTSFMLRVNMSLNILAMVQQTRTANHTTNLIAVEETAIGQATNVGNASTTDVLWPDLNGTIASTENGSTFISNPTEVEAGSNLQNFGPRYQWDQKTQGNILGAYFYGYLLTSLPAGPLAERFGPKLLITVSFFVCAIATAVTPFLAEWGAWAIIGSRGVIGLLAGVVYPGLHNLISQWIPPNERGKVIACLAGGSTFGTVVTWPIAAVITERFGWPSSFYASAVFVLLITILWVCLIVDSPAQHSSITETEKQLIEDSFGGTLSRSKSLPPFGKVFTSLPLLSLLVLHFGNFWGLSFFITQAPKFMNEVLGFNLSKAGFLSSLPYLARMISGFIFGFVGDLIRQKQIMSTTALRKTFCLFSHIIPGALSLPLFGKDPLVCVGFIVACLGVNGAATITDLVNAQDLAPNFAATLYGVMSFFGTTAGFIAPMLVAHFTSEQNTMEQWESIFYINASIYLITGLNFIVFGSGKVQSWNEVEQKPSAIEFSDRKATKNIECNNIKKE
ncbi:sialin-like [Armigeres subalbatus]|uniref:sialin-like n=1 Tax=Armigeres subalbatus TaxID=124917 RepID=UPI002ED0497D